MSEREAFERIGALLDKAEKDMRALELWDYALKSVPAGAVQELIQNIRAAAKADRGEPVAWMYEPDIENYPHAVGGGHRSFAETKKPPALGYKGPTPLYK